MKWQKTSESCWAESFTPATCGTRLYSLRNIVLQWLTFKMCLKLKQNLVVARCGIVVLDLLPPSHFVKQVTPLHAPCASNPHHLLLVRICCLLSHNNTVTGLDRGCFPSKCCWSNNSTIPPKVGRNACHSDAERQPPRPKPSLGCSSPAPKPSAFPRPVLTCSACGHVQAQCWASNTFSSLNKVSGWTDSQHWWLASLKQNNSIEKHRKFVSPMTACRCSSRAALVPCFQDSHLPKPSRPFVLRFEACGTPTGGLSLHTGRAVPGGGNPVLLLQGRVSKYILKSWDLKSQFNPSLDLHSTPINCPWKQNAASWTQLFQRAGTDYCLWDNICFNQLVWYTRKSNKTSGVAQLWSRALIPYYVANQATVIRSRSHCTVTCAVSSCAGVRAWSTVSLYHCRVVNVKLAVQCCYNSHMSVVNVNGVCNMVKMDTFSFQMWCKLCTVKEFFLYFLSTECLPELLLN